MYETRLSGAKRRKQLEKWEYESDRIKRYQNFDTSNYANWNVSVIAYGKKPQYRNE